MGVDWPDEASDEHSNEQDGHNGSHRSVPAETRSREECYADQHEAVSAQESATARQNAADEQAAAEKWDKSAEEFRWMWGEYQRRWPPDERPPIDNSADPPGSWRGERDRYLDQAANDRVEAACDRVADREREKISPAMRDIESQDADRHLTGFDYRLKDRDRIKEKVHDVMEEFNFSPEEAVSLVPDAIRYTVQYRDSKYAQGVYADIGRMKDQGFELLRLKNSWSSDQYKGINTQWVEPATGQRLEVQFHTRVSFEGKQLTHKAYERLRTYQADRFEQMVLEAFQRTVTAEVPVPPGAGSIPNYPPRGTDAG